MAADVSFFLELGLTEDWSAHIDVPAMRPLLFGAAFEMLQFEPSVSIRRRVRTGGGGRQPGPGAGASRGWTARQLATGQEHLRATWPERGAGSHRARGCDAPA
jgi:hypothetical protein